jgi:GntR family transcriptional regulator
MDRMTYEPIRRRGVSRLSREQWGMGKSIWTQETQGRELVQDRIMVSREGAPADIAELLRLRAGDPLCIRRRRFSVDGRPVQLASSYLSYELVRGSAITQTNTGQGGTYARLAVLGFKPVRFREEAFGRPATQDEIARLELDGPPWQVPWVIQMQRIAFASEGKPVEITRMVLDASVYVMEYEFSA